MFLLNRDGPSAAGIGVRRYRRDEAHRASKVFHILSTNAHAQKGNQWQSQPSSQLDALDRLYSAPGYATGARHILYKKVICVWAQERYSLGFCVGLKPACYARPYKSFGAPSPRAHYACALFPPRSVGESHFVGGKFFSHLMLYVLPATSE